LINAESVIGNGIIAPVVEIMPSTNSRNGRKNASNHLNESRSGGTTTSFAMEERPLTLEEIN
jgi:hypothetical protein